MLSTEVVSAATSSRSTIELTNNQVNFLRNHDGAKSEKELLGNAFLCGVNVADMKRVHSKTFVTRAILETPAQPCALFCHSVPL